MAHARGHREEQFELLPQKPTIEAMVVKLSANTLSWMQEFSEGTMDLKDMIEECYHLRLDGISPAQNHIAEPDSKY